MPFFEHDGLRFHYLDIGEGVPFCFQHGLGGDTGQITGLFAPPPGFRLLAQDSRGHGQTRPLGDESKLTIRQLADDLLALLDHLRIERAVIGGISMGAALAQNFAIRYPERTLGVVLSRPAWFEGPVEFNMRVFPLVSRLLREHGPQRGKELFQTMPEYAQALRESPPVAASLLAQFDHPRAVETAAKLERIPYDQPMHTLADLKTIRVPVLVLSNRFDPIHPFEFGPALAAAIPGAIHRELTSRVVDSEQHNRDVQRFIQEFLIEHFGEQN